MSGFRSNRGYELITNNAHFRSKLNIEKGQKSSTILEYITMCAQDDKGKNYDIVNPASFILSINLSIYNDVSMG